MRTVSSRKKNTLKHPDAKQSRKQIKQIKHLKLVSILEKKKLQAELDYIDGWLE